MDESAKYPSVTEILNPYVDFSMVSEHILTRATDRGKTVHSICAGICQGLWIPEVSEECEGYIESFQGWFDSQVKEILLVEEELIDEVYSFKGHPDIIVKIPEGIVLVDLKTPTGLQKAWRLQLAAYLRLARKFKPEKAGSLRLNADGKTAKMEWYKDSAQDFNIFLGLLNAHNYFK